MVHVIPLGLNSSFGDSADLLRSALSPGNYQVKTKFSAVQRPVRLLLIEMSQLGILDLSPMVKHGELPCDKG